MDKVSSHQKRVIKKSPTGFVATCQCGIVFGAMDYRNVSGKDAGKILGQWLHDGCTVTPRFAGNWWVDVEPCQCDK